MTSEVVKTPNGNYMLRFFDEDGSEIAIKRGRIHLPPDPEAEERSRRAVQEVFRQMYEAQQAAKA